MESLEHNGAYIIISPLIYLRADFLAWGIFLRVLSEYDKQSHHFANLNFCDVTLLFSIHYWNVVLWFSIPLYLLSLPAHNFEGSQLLNNI